MQVANNSENSFAFKYLILKRKFKCIFLYFKFHTGASAGNIVSFPVSGILCESTFLGGWPSAFYVFGKCNSILHVVYISSFLSGSHSVFCIFVHKWLYSTR